MLKCTFEFKDPVVFDYEYDSDEDWEDEGEGESLSDAEDEKEIQHLHFPRQLSKNISRHFLRVNFMLFLFD